MSMKLRYSIQSIFYPAACVSVDLFISSSHGRTKRACQYQGLALTVLKSIVFHILLRTLLALIIPTNDGFISLFTIEKLMQLEVL